MTKKIVLCLIFFIFSPLIIFSAIFFSDSLRFGKVLGEMASPNSNLLSSSEEDSGKVVFSTVKAEDSTLIIIEKYLKRYGSPLFEHSSEIVFAGEKYGVSPRLIVAIAQQESNLGKVTPKNCYNAWGWGIHSKGTRCFESWSEAIDIVTKGIAKDYCAKGYCEDPCLMMQKYTPHSNGSWCAGVNQFLAEMETGEF